MEIRLKEPQRFRALLADPVKGREQFIESLMENRGFVISAKFDGVPMLVEQDDRPEAKELLGQRCGGLATKQSQENRPWTGPFPTSL